MESNHKRLRSVRLAIGSTPRVGHLPMLATAFGLKPKLPGSKPVPTSSVTAFVGSLPEIRTQTFTGLNRFPLPDWGRRPLLEP